MKSNDSVRVYGHSMLIHFGSTGESQASTSLKLDTDGITFSLDKASKAITVTSHGLGAERRLETFGSENLASAAFGYLKNEHTRYARRRLLIGWYKGALRWVLGPLLLFVFILAAFTAVGNAQIEPSVASVKPSATLAAAQTQGQSPSQAEPVTKLSPDSKLLAKALQDGVASDKYSVQLSAGDKGTLFVFSDPLCPYCQRLEGQLEKLAADYTIHIFPVSVIGGEDSTAQLGPVLCGTAPAARAERWKKATGGNIDRSATGCAESTEILTANNEFFRAMQFDGTPAIVNVLGQQFPSSTRATAENITQWLQGASR
ncbi:DsbC family protein [Pseudomonas siliginis]|uniref:DsbC family protein n=1 Tax=Pseudomonas siliginis TaxID=2842346 RepID=UPI002092F6C7|nr:DsbC family protein [Pseudomonas siliginis]UST77186.1 DsbC family protein [Pseudomonas siliginis]